MDTLLQKRTPVRRTFTRTANALEEELKLPKPDVDKVTALLLQLEDKGHKLAELDKAILDLLQSSTCTQEEYDAEFDGADAYSDRLLDLSARGKRFLEKKEGQGQSGSLQASEFSAPNLKTYRLPELELKKFSGDVKDWLGFWGQFQKIDSDPNVAPEDKYQYLLQSTVEKSRAREIVESFPPTGENYVKAVEHLKSRFGREETLVEVYIRDLLRLVLKNSQNRKQKVDLSALYDKLETQLRALETLGVTSEKYAAMLYPLVESCLPEETLKAWERNKGFKASVSVSESEEEKGADRLTLLMQFLRDEVDGEERVRMARAGFGIETESQKRPVKREQQYDNVDIPTAAGLFNSPQGLKNDVVQTCIFCSKKHASSECWRAKKMSLEEKRQILSRNGCCFLCLKRGHVSRRCTGKQKCTYCGKRHFLLMCSEKPLYPSAESVNKNETFEMSKDIKDSVLTNQVCTSSVKLQTLKVYLRGKCGRRVFRALIDSGSQRSYISSQAAKLMGYEAIGEESVVHSLFGGLESTPQKLHRFRIYLTSLDESYNCNFEALSQEKICGNICGIQDGPWMSELLKKGVTLTDTCYLRPTAKEPEIDIQLLIGADVAGKLLTGRIHNLSCGLVAVGTRLGWTVMGKMPKKENLSVSSLSVISLLAKDASVADLWRLESIGITDPSESQTKEDLQRAAYEHFRNTVTVNDEGRYEVSLPWLETHPTISDGYHLAERRLLSTIKRLNAENILKSYQEVFHSWSQDGIIEEIATPQEKESGKPGHYLPHRAVIKDSSTTKIRPVFDASAHEKNSPSLNSCLEKGPNLLEVIPSILTRFRMGKFGVIADIRQAFLQISVKESDRNFLCFLWLEDGDPERKRCYRHCRVVFGLTSSPFLLGATIAYHLESVAPEFKETANRLQESFYVDNCVTSVDSNYELGKFISESRQIMLEAKFDLRGWQYNESPDKIAETSAEKQNRKELDKVPSPIVPVLGMCWNVEEDVLFCKLNGTNYVEGEPVTKRKVLSTTQQVFDPLGVICPITLLPKLLLQEAWNLKLSWDEELPEDISRKFLKWLGQLEELERIKVPRWIIGGNYTPDRWTLHVFCDASKYAYATCVFVRVDKIDSVYCQLVRAKTRVAPLKPVTIPRLELLACCIGARLTDVVKRDIHCPNVETFYWTDSANAFYWIKNNEQWAVFVANRVKEIRSLSDPENWHHIPGKQNPADIASRGCSVQQFMHLSWWEGPEWLSKHPDNWPKSVVTPEDELINAERKKRVISGASSIVETPWYEKYSSFRRIVRIIAWMFRFLRNARRSGPKRYSNILTVQEMEDAETALLKLIQVDAFDGIRDPVLRSLQPLVDEKGVIRTKTRLIARVDTENFRYPAVLPSKHPVVILLIQEKHRELSHAGIQILMAHLRENYWILQCRKTVRKVVKKCGRCRRFTVRRMEAVPAPLPEDRIRDAAVFEIVGIDLGGPLYLKGGEKTWFVLFTCAVVRAVHIELVTSLSTDTFLLSLRRFIARRGRPRVIYSDNGTNFVGAENAFSEIDWAKISEEAGVKRIMWHFIPPTAAWWGGWWERLVRMIKEILRRVLGRASLTYEELSTVFCEVESVLNNRPLTYLSEDVEDLSPLTPALFLHEIKDDRTPDLDVVLDGKGLNKRYRYRGKLREDIRKRFRNEYLGQLRYVCKAKRYAEPLRVGQVVLIGSDHTKRLEWPLGKVLELYPGKDGHIRVARLKTKNGELLRPVQRLYPLELDEVQGESLRENTPLSEHLLERQMSTDRSDDPVSPARLLTRSGRSVKRPERLMFDSFK